MLKKIFFLLIPFLGFSQVQIGADINGINTDDRFGHRTSLSSDGSTLAVGAYLNGDSGSNSGEVKVFENIGGVWTQIGSDINGADAGDFFGFSLSLSSDGTTLAVGAYSNGDSGSNFGEVKVFENIGGVWTQIGSDINGEADSDRFGFSVSLSGDGTTLAVGATRNDDGETNSGHAKIYKNTGGVWTQIGANINGEAGGDQSGYSIGLSNNGLIVAIGANGSDDACENCGHVRAFEYSSTTNTWIQIGLDIDGEEEDEFSGIRLSLSGDGNTIAVGSHLSDVNGKIDSGRVRVFKNIANSWTQIGLSLNGDNADDYFGNSISLSDDGSIIAISASRKDVNGLNSGQVKLFKNVSNTWTQIGLAINGDDENDGFGANSLSSDGSIIAIGATGDDGEAIDSGKVRVYDISDVILSSTSFNRDYFSLHPNPTSNFLNIDFDNVSEFKKATIYNYLGQVISEENKTKIDVSKYSKGYYFLEIETSNRKVTKQFIIE